MSYNATFERLTEKFECTGYANINGRRKEYQWGGGMWIGDLESQWELRTVSHNGDTGIILDTSLKH